MLLPTFLRSLMRILIVSHHITSIQALQPIQPSLGPSLLISLYETIVP
ncbi:hypothetical protein FTV88_0640 [Heliorestis convoluta]|uniref:Uncharacterized protein n=1 Tax=Heliorestis convoluta TaxID=356322 RepID=A0A5Q2MZD6_9FIRM|nr:hypothetical protein FTV88_0640 [Heliorestis convoluta]